MMSGKNNASYNCHITHKNNQTNKSIPVIVITTVTATDKAIEQT